MGWVVDLDGVMWRGRAQIEGSADAVNRLLRTDDVLFVTNAAGTTTEEKENRLVAMGGDGRGRVLTSAVAACRLFDATDRVLVIGSRGLAAELGAHGIEMTDEPVEASAVLVGYDDRFDYAAMRRATTAVLNGARLVGTNHDPSFPTEHGLIPGNGALVASVATAAGVRPEFAGKPHPPTVDAVRERLGPDGVVVGDRLDSDGALARALGYRFGLVLSGVTASTAGVEVGDLEPGDVVADDLSSLVDRLVA